MFHPKSVSRGVAGSYCSVYYMGIGDLQYLLNISITTENFVAEAVRLYSFSATPGKQCLLPKVSLGGLRDRTVEYTTWVLGITVFAQSFHYNRKFEAKAVRLYSFPATPGKQCLLPKVSLGGLWDRTVEYITWVLGITVFPQSFHYNREFRGQSCSAVLIVRNPRKAMFHPKSVSRGVAGSYCSVYYMGIGDYSICSIFPLQQRISRPRLVSCNYSFPATPGKQCLRPKVSLEGLRDRTVEYITWVLGITVFAQSFHYNREFRSQSCSAVLIFRNPQKAMFASKSVSRGVAGSYG